MFTQNPTRVLSPWPIMVCRCFAFVLSYTGYCFTGRPVASAANLCRRITILELHLLNTIAWANLSMFRCKVMWKFRVGFSLGGNQARNTKRKYYVCVGLDFFFWNWFLLLILGSQALVSFILQQELPSESFSLVAEEVKSSLPSRSIGWLFTQRHPMQIHNSHIFFIRIQEIFEHPAALKCFTA